MASLDHKYTQIGFNLNSVQVCVTSFKINTKLIYELMLTILLKCTIFEDKELSLPEESDANTTSDVGG